jgi:tRNA modification GTPase
MFSTTDTIVAIATPPGRGGIGVVRLSGPDAHAIAERLTGRHERLRPRYATLATIRSRENEITVGLKPDTTFDRAAPAGVVSAFSVTAPTQSTPTDAVVVSGVNQTVSASVVVSTLRRTSSDSAIDQAIVTYFPAPASYTGDEVVEISAHGSPVVLKAIVSAAIDGGARLAEPGEFTLRAFVNGRIDLPQAEAVGDLIDAATPLQARAAFDQLNGTLTAAIAEIDRSLFDLIARLEASVDFPEEGYHFVDPAELAAAIDTIRERTTALLRDARRGRLIREGLQVAIVGRPNVGKSSLFNALVGAARAIVTEVPGTTRDLISETVDVNGLRVTLVDTAGLRETADVVESEGVSRSRGAADVADVILFLCDISDPSSIDSLMLESASPRAVSDQLWDPALAGLENRTVLTREKKVLVVANKADLPRAWSLPDAVEVSATTGQGLEALRQRIAMALDVDLLADRPEITNVRHATLVERADEALARARDAALADGHSMPEEFVLADLQDARAALEEITGRRAPEDLLAHIFTRFCIGK